MSPAWLLGYFPSRPVTSSTSSLGISVSTRGLLLYSEHAANVDTNKDKEQGTLLLQFLCGHDNRSSVLELGMLGI